MLGCSDPRRRRDRCGPGAGAAVAAADAPSSAPDADGAEARPEPAAASSSSDGPVMDHELFLRRVRELGALNDDEHAERAAKATLAVLSEVLTPDEAERCKRRLPRELGVLLVGRYPALVFGMDELAARVARAEHAMPGVAREHVEAVCTVIGEALGAETRMLLAGRLDFGLGRLFTLPPKPTRPPPPRKRGRRHPSTLAEGRPGSEHPISEARPSRAQTHSVAANDDPHAETKLSSSRGLTQERLDETLAAGRPPTKRSIAGT